MELKKYLLVGLASLSLGLGIGFSSASPIHAATFSHYIKSHLWIRTTDGSQGGYHDKTRFTNRTLTAHGKWTGTYTWRFYNLRKTNVRTYYANVKYTKNGKKHPVKVRLISKNTIWMLRKHMWGLKGNYSGNSNYGATIFKRAH